MRAYSTKVEPKTPEQQKQFDTWLESLSEPELLDAHTNLIYGYAPLTKRPMLRLSDDGPLPTQPLTKDLDQARQDIRAVWEAHPFSMKSLLSWILGDRP